MAHENERFENDLWQKLDQRQTATVVLETTIFSLVIFFFAFRKSPGLLCCIQKPDTTPSKQLLPHLLGPKRHSASSVHDAAINWDATHKWLEIWDSRMLFHGNFHVIPSVNLYFYDGTLGSEQILQNSETS